MKRVICILTALLLFGGLARAQVNLEEEFFSLPDSVTNSYLDSIEPGFSGTMLLKLKNGSKDYVSRTYLPAFKKYLGL